MYKRQLNVHFYDQIFNIWNLWIMALCGLELMENSNTLLTTITCNKRCSLYSNPTSLWRSWLCVCWLSGHMPKNVELWCHAFTHTEVFKVISPTVWSEVFWRVKYLNVCIKIPLNTVNCTTYMRKLIYLKKRILFYIMFFQLKWKLKYMIEH